MTVSLVARQPLYRGSEPRPLPGVGGVLVGEWGGLAGVYRIYLSVWAATHSAPNGPTELTMAHPSPSAR